MEKDTLGVPNFRLYLNGNELSRDLMSAVEGVTVEDEINVPAMFTIKFNIVDYSSGRWRGIDLETFKPGDEVKIYMGIDSTVEIMTGEITALDVTFGEYSSMEIRGYDRLHRLRFGTKRRTYQDVKDSDIASSIASEVGLSAKVEDTGTVYPHIYQNNQSNYDFLMERAQRIGYELLVNDREFIFRPSQEDKTPEKTLRYGRELESLSVQLKTLTKGSDIEVRGWDIKKKQEIKGTASDGSETTIMAGSESGQEIFRNAFGDSSVSVLDTVVIDSSDADNIAKALYNRVLKEFVTGEGKCAGLPDIRAGKTLEIRDIGERFSGAYYVDSSTHTVNDGGYTTAFKVRRTGV